MYLEYYISNKCAFESVDFSDNPGRKLVLMVVDMLKNM